MDFGTTNPSADPSPSILRLRKPLRLHLYLDGDKQFHILFEVEDQPRYFQFLFAANANGLRNGTREVSIKKSHFWTFFQQC
jgi:hypothetical protein